MTASSHLPKTVVLLLITVALSLSLAGVAGAATATPDAHVSHHSDATPSPAAVCASPPVSTPVSGGMVAGASTPGVHANQDFDLMFIDLMIPHHESAIAMAQIALVRGEHPEIRDLAQQIITSQQAEINQMKAWRDAWYPGAAAIPADQLQHAMDGMAGTPSAGMGAMSGMDPASEARENLYLGYATKQGLNQWLNRHERSIAGPGITPGFEVMRFR